MTLKKFTVIVPKDSVFNGVGKQSGKAFTTQTMGLESENGLTQQFSAFLKNPSEALQPGRYGIDIDSVFVDRKSGNLIIKPAFIKA